MGTLNKVILEFPSSAVWDNVLWIERTPLPADGGKWQEFFSLRKTTGRPIIVAFNAGDPALYPASVTDATLVSEAVAALRAMFGTAQIPDPVNSWVTRWQDDPWSRGSYSTVKPGANGKERVDLAAPVKGLLYFAGEATNVPTPSTVNGAYTSGQVAAAKLAAEDTSS
jgi:polyamine oxidase